MKTIIAIVRGIINVLLFTFYSLFFIIASDFVYGFVLKKILGESVPGPENTIHIKLAMLVLFGTLVITLLFRKYFYIPLKSKEGD